MDEEQRRRNPDLYDAYQKAKLAFAIGRAVPWVWIIVITIAGIVLFSAAIGISTGTQGTASETQTSNETSINTTKTNLNVSFYCQYQDTWSANGCDIAHYGCDPTSLAMIFSSFGDKQWTPYYTAVNNGFMGCGYSCDKDTGFCGTTIQQTRDAINNAGSYGYTSGISLAEGRNFDLIKAKKYIESGYLIHAAANVYFMSGGTLNNPNLTSGGHSFVIIGVDPIAKTVTILDPTYCISDTNYVTKTMNVYNDILFDKKYGDGWFWAYPIKKVVNTQ